MLLNGQMIHYALSLISTFDKADFNSVIKSCMEKVAIMYPNENINWLEPVLINLLSNNEISRFFDKSNKVFNEKEFVDKFGNTIRIDKLVVKKDSIDIIDFKNSIYDKEYIQKQIKNYYYVLSEIYKDKKINLFVVNIEKNEIIEVNV
jgi:ATP-dependent exoDNAse (exonuclease V) beta subunit